MQSLRYLLCMLVTSTAVRLSNYQTNGLSTLGLLETPHLPRYLADEYFDHPPWKLSSSSVPNQGWEIPEHGRIRQYHWTVSRGYLSPDGYNKSGIFVNNQFPGPTIEVNWGDWIEVTVHNNITGNEGTAIHWHGLSQRGTQENDGVPSVTQCPIAPGASYTYRFRADVFGTSFWHSHYSAQWTAGVFGGLVIYGPQHTTYDDDVGLVLLGDYYHDEYFAVIENVVANSTDFDVYVPTSNNSLINGRNSYDCSKSHTTETCHNNIGHSRFRFGHGKVHRLRLVNVGSAALVHFSIDGHRMEVISHDFTMIHPYLTEVVALGAGQRADVLVRGIGDRTAGTEGLAIVVYDDAPVETKPTTVRSAAAAAADEKSFLCQDEPLQKILPITSKPASSRPDSILTVNVSLGVNATGQNVWLLNNVTEYSDYNEPLLLLANRDDHMAYFDPAWSVHDFADSRTIRIVMNTDYQSAHPMHLHGHQFAVLAQGSGVFDGYIDPAILANPPRRDTTIMPRYGHTVIQFEADNPGAWSYHCHIAWHAAAGYTLNFLERPDRVRSDWIEVAMVKTCGPWEAWGQVHIVDQIDAGV